MGFGVLTSAGDRGFTSASDASAGAPAGLESSTTSYAASGLRPKHLFMFPMLARKQQNSPRREACARAPDPS